MKQAFLLGAAFAATCPYGFKSESKSLAQTSDPSFDEILYPSQLFKCPDAVKQTDVDNFHVSDYEAIVRDVIEEYEKIDATVEDNHNLRADFAGCIVRMAGHDLMDFRIGDEKDSGGSDGCVNFADKDNAGLAQCLTKANMPNLYCKYSSKVSLADFIVIIAEAAMGRTATDWTGPEQMFNEGKLAKTFRDYFLVGRKTAETCDWNQGRMPNPERGCSDLREVFLNNIFYGNQDGWALTTAISGVHSLGKASPQNSGYDGAWSDAKSQGVFNNDYYRSLLFKGWGPELSVGGDPDKNQWKRVDLGSQNNHKEMMLNSDLCLILDNNRMYAQCSAAKEAAYLARKNGREAEYNEFFEEGDSNCLKWIYKGKTLLATEGNCCAWVHKKRLSVTGAFNEGHEEEYCSEGGPASFERKTCCKHEAGDSYGDCDMPDIPGGVASFPAAKFAGDEKYWLEWFTSAWKQATQNSFKGELVHLDETSRQKESENETWEFEEDPRGCAVSASARECRARPHCTWGMHAPTKAEREAWEELKAAKIDQLQTEERELSEEREQAEKDLEELISQFGMYGVQQREVRTKIRDSKPALKKVQRRLIAANDEVLITPWKSGCFTDPDQFSARKKN